MKTCSLVQLPLFLYNHSQSIPGQWRPSQDKNRPDLPLHHYRNPWIIKLTHNAHHIGTLHAYSITDLSYCIPLWPLFGEDLGGRNQVGKHTHDLLSREYWILNSYFTSIMVIFFFGGFLQVQTYPISLKYVLLDGMKSVFEKWKQRCFFLFLFLNQNLLIARELFKHNFGRRLFIRQRVFSQGF